VGQRALSGSLYYSAFRWVDRLMAAASSVLLARWLAPEEFGLVALAMTAISLLQSFSEMGFGAGVVQRADCDDQDYNVAWTYGRAVRGLVLFVLMLLLAPWIARFYEEPQLAAIVRVLAFDQLFVGFTNIGAYALLIKELDYRSDFLFSLSGRLVRLVVVIPLAFFWRNAWALVAGSLAERATRMVVSYYVHSYRPRFNFDLHRARRLLLFGGWLVGVQLVNTLRGVVDRTVLGRILGTTEMGYYQAGNAFGGQVPAEVKTVVSKVMFPVYSLMQEDRRRLANSFRQVLSLVLFLSLPLSVGLVLTAEYFVALVIGERWLPAIAIIHVLVMAGFVQVVTGTGRPLYRGTGRPKLELIVSAVALVVTSILLVPLTKTMGATGTAYAVLAGNCSVLVLWWVFVRRITGLPVKDMIGTALPPVVATALMTGAVLAVRGVTGDSISWGAFVASVLAGAASYAVCLWLAWRILRVDSLERLIGQLLPYWNRLVSLLSRRVGREVPS